MARGHMISFVHLKGGVGSSSLVAMIAQYLSNQGKQVGVVDFCLSSPSVAMYLGYDLDKIPEGNITRASEIPADDELFGSCFYVNEKIHKNIYMLTPSVKEEFFKYDDIGRDEVLNILGGCHQLLDIGLLDYVLVDTTSNVEEVTTYCSIEEASRVILVVDKMLSSAKLTSRIANRLSYFVDKMSYVINRDKDYDHVSIESINMVMSPLKYLGRIPHDDLIMEAIDRGVVFSTLPSYHTNKGYEQIGALMHRIDLNLSSSHKAGTEETKKGLFGRLFKKRKKKKSKRTTTPKKTKGKKGLFKRKSKVKDKVVEKPVLDERDQIIIALDDDEDLE